MADLVTVSSPQLAEALGCAPSRFRLAPNVAFPGADHPLPARQADMLVTLLVAASDRVAAGTLLAVLRALQARHGDDLKVVGVGVAGDDLAAAGIATRRVPMLPRARFVEFVRSLPNAVAVIPLDASLFSASNSVIMWFDYAAIGGLVTDCETAWDAALSRALDDMAWLGRVARAARAEVRGHRGFDVTVDAWLSALDEALVRPADRLHRPPTGWQRWRRTLTEWASDRLVDLPQFNRDRIDCRQRARINP